MNKELTQLPLIEQAGSGFSRRKFLGLAGGLAAAGVMFNACNNDDDDNPNPSGSVVLTNDDFGVLNYAYALEQLEAAFYSRVVTEGFYVSAAANATEKALLTDIRDHEVAHMEFFKAALGTNAIRSLANDLDFSSIDFSSRTSVLETARTFEDLGVSAYNGAAKLIQLPKYLVLAGKIVSVEARHAAYIRDLLSNGTFASSFGAGDNQIDANGLDVAKEPAAVLLAASTFVKANFVNNLPTS